MMTHPSLRSIALVVSAAMALAACGQDGAATEEDYDQVAQSLAATSPGESSAVVIASELALGTAPLGLHLAGLGRFEGDLFGLSWQLAITCRDATGAELRCGAGTDAAVIDGAWSGTLTLPRLTASAHRTGHWELTGLQSATATLAGDAHGTLDAAFTSASGANTKTLALTYDATYEAVAIDTASRLAVGGRVHYVVDATRTHTTPGTSERAAFGVDAVLEFTADGAWLVLDGDHRYMLDLAAGTAIRVTGA